MKTFTSVQKTESASDSTEVYTHILYTLHLYKKLIMKTLN